MNSDPWRKLPLEIHRMIKVHMVGGDGFRKRRDERISRTMETLH